MEIFPLHSGDCPWEWQLYMEISLIYHEILPDYEDAKPHTLGTVHEDGESVLFCLIWQHWRVIQHRCQ
jgi:hypothetical protein